MDENDYYNQLVEDMKGSIEVWGIDFVMRALSDAQNELKGA
jgi:hypothetical protein